MSGTSQPRVLVVDDEEANRLLIRAILVPLGFLVVEVDSGERCLARLAEGGIDLVLLDVLMPGIDGVETCRRIRRDTSAANLPVIIVTALADSGSRTRGKEAGADDFLTKPIVEDELIACVRNRLLVRAQFERSESQRTQAEREARRWKLLSDVAGAVSVCRDYTTLQRTILATLAQDLRARGSLLLEFDGDELVVVSVLDRVEDGSQALVGRRLAVRREACLEALQTRRVLRAAGGGESTFGSILDASGVANALVVPVLVAGTLQALFLLANPRGFGDEDEALVDELAPHLGNAIANVRSHVKAEELNRAKERLSALLVHDLKSPIQVIELNLDALGDAETAADDRAESLADARAATAQLLCMLLDLLDISRAEEGRLTTEPVLVRIEPFLQEILQRYRAVAQSRSVRVACAVDAALGASFDRKLMRRVIENIVNNAFRYVPREGHVAITAGREDGELVLRIENDGPPIPAAVARGLFDKYGATYEGQQHSNRGLGLYFCRLVIDAHGGRIGFSPSQGVCFEIRLPMTRPALGG